MLHKSMGVSEGSKRQWGIVRLWKENDHKRTNEIRLEVEETDTLELAAEVNTPLVTPGGQTELK